MEIKTPQGTVCGMIPENLLKQEPVVEETPVPVKKPSTRKTAVK